MASEHPDVTFSINGASTEVALVQTQYYKEQIVAFQDTIEDGRQGVQTELYGRCHAWTTDRPALSNSR